MKAIIKFCKGFLYYKEDCKASCPFSDFGTFIFKDTTCIDSPELKKRLISMLIGPTRTS